MSADKSRPPDIDNTLFYQALWSAATRATRSGGVHCQNCLIVLLGNIWSDVTYSTISPLVPAGRTLRGFAPNGGFLASIGVCIIFTVPVSFGPPWLRLSRACAIWVVCE